MMPEFVRVIGTRAYALRELPTTRTAAVYEKRRNRK
jgi:hypothetical protein